MLDTRYLSNSVEEMFIAQGDVHRAFPIISELLKKDYGTEGRVFDTCSVSIPFEG